MVRKEPPPPACVFASVSNPDDNKDPMRPRFFLTAVAVLLLAATAPACGPASSPPELDALTDQVAFVGAELRVELRASDPDFDELRFRFDNDDLTDLADRAEIRNYGNGLAVFYFTPLASDVGVHPFDFVANDPDGQEDRETITVEVRPADGEAAAPVFRQPLGSGTTLDLSVRTCLDLDVVVEDPDSPAVTIAEDAPLLDGAELTDTAANRASWHWCPSADQIAASDRHTLLLSADDGEHPPTAKHFVILLRRPSNSDCEGAPPTITHAAENEATLAGLTIAADVADVEGLKGAPLLYYATSNPGARPDLSTMTQVTMLEIAAPTWAADVPNPVAGMPAGSTADLWYVIAAEDDDDAAGDCDHVTQAPATGAFKMTVTHPGGAGGLGLCEACTHDDQCGDAGDNCLVMGGTGSYCFTGCTGAAGECPATYYCSISMLSSVDGVAARQCIPEDFSCAPDMVTCIDDDLEPNDTRVDASPITPGTQVLDSCPTASGDAQDDDWFKFTITGGAKLVTLSLDGDAPPDLDLRLVGTDGTTVLVRSEGLTSIEDVSRCLPAGTYYAVVYSVLEPAPAGYLFDLGVGAACTP